MPEQRSPTAQDRHGPPAVNWPRLVGVGAFAASVSFLTKPPRDPRWKGGILFDNATRNTLKASSHNTRDDAEDLSDWTLYTSIAPYGLLSLHAALWGRDEVRAYRRFGNGVESLLLTTGVTTASKNAVGRQRPLGRACAHDKQYAGECGEREENASFISGHASTSMNAAGLVCAAHTKGGLFANDGTGWLACGSSVGASLAAGTLRVVADQHYITDVLAGWAVGWASGYCLHYDCHLPFFRRTERSSLLPQIGPQEVGLRYTVDF